MMQRKHTTTACLICRESKTKCDGVRPVCGSCKKKRKQCEYSAKDDKRKLSLRTAVELLYKRVEQLTALANKHNLIIPAMDTEELSILDQICTSLDLSPTALVPQAVHQPNFQAPNSPPDTGSFPEVASYDGSLAGNTIQDPTRLDLSWHASQNTDFDAQSWTEFFTVEPWDGSPSDWPWQMMNDFTGLNSYVPTQPATIAQNGADVQTIQPGSESTTDDEVEGEILPRLAQRFGSLRVAADGILRYYGTASNYHFLNGMRQAEFKSDVEDIQEAARTALENAQLDEEAPISLQDHLLELFFTWHNPIHSTVDRTMFELARGQASVHQRAYCSQSLVNAMCAIGAAFEGRYHSSFVTFPKPLAEYFADRSKIFLEFEFDCPSVSTVQALLLLSSHEAASGKDGRMWLYSGMAMRLAFDVGLHVDSSPYVKQGILSVFEAEARRTAFWSCVVVNHLWSFSLGRPFRVDSEETTVSRPNDQNDGINTVWIAYPSETHDPLAAASIAPTGNSSTAFITGQWVSLCEELAPLIRVLYGCVKISKAALQKLSYNTTQRLERWHETIPDTIKIQTGRTPFPHVIMLHMAYHNFCILIHRPWSTKSSQPETRVGPGHQHARRICRTSASEIAGLLRIYESHYGFRKMNVYVVNIIFSASLILIFGLIAEDILGEREHSDKASISKDLNTCFRALDELGQSFESAKRIHEHLLAIQKQWSQRKRDARAGAKRRNRNQISSIISQKRSRPSSSTAMSSISHDLLLN